MTRRFQHKLIVVILLLIFIPATVVLANHYLTEKTVLLTFDDGPHPLYTPKILSILRENDIKAIFFVVGSEVEKYPDLLKSIHKDGHLIANHTYSHSIITGLDKQQLVNEIQKTDKIIKEITGEEVIYFRPPTGAYGEEQAEILEELRKKVLMWDYGLEKKAIKHPEELVDYLLSRIDGKNELNLLLHDGDPSNIYSREMTVEALPILIEEFKSRGYIFVNPDSSEGMEYIDVFSDTNTRIGIF